MPETRRPHCMKLAVIIYILSPWSGLSRDCIRIVKHASEIGHDITVFIAREQGQATDQLPASSRVVILKPRGFNNHARMHSFGKQAFAKVQSANFDASLGFNRLPGFDFYYCADASFIYRVRTQRSFFYRLTPRYRSMATAERAVFGLHATSRVFFISDALHSQYRQEHAVADERTIVLPPFVDADRSSEIAALPNAANIRATLDLPTDRLIILAVGSGFRTKGVDRSIRALAALPNELKNQVCLVVVGRGKKEPLVRFAETLGVRDQVKFVGPANHVPIYMKAADLLLHPARNEASGTVLVEAMQAGLPVMCSAVCGYAAVVIGASAGIVLQEPFEQPGLNRLLTSMLNQLADANWGENGQRHIQVLEQKHMPSIILDAMASSPNVRVTDCYLAESLKTEFPELRDFDSVMHLDGETYRRGVGRHTFKIQGPQKSFFVKQHSGVGWGEIFKNLISLKLPVLGAQAEWRGAHRLQSLGIDTLDAVGFGRKGLNAARQQSFFISRELPASLSLESLPALLEYRREDRKNDTNAQLLHERRSLIKRVARIVQRLHRSGINHRDLYLCHFWLEDSEKPLSDKKLFLIDLHRMQFRKQIPSRWRIKDLGGLYYSAANCNLSKMDVLRFIKEYSNGSLRATLTRDSALWAAVARRANRMTQSGKSG